jgi:hypothetical protein
MAGPMMTPKRIGAFPRATTPVTPVEVTAAQATQARVLVRVLRAIDDGDVWQEASGRSVETYAEYFGYYDPIGDVTEEVNAAQKAGLAEPRPLTPGPGAAWDLTKAGVKVLADLHAKESDR